jgi:hypothetical protein
MPRFAVLSLVLLAAFGLAACGSEPYPVAPQPPPPPPPSAEPTDAATTAPTAPPPPAGPSLPWIAGRAR